ncbi:hypothetical protein [Thalassoroseus pseudoceratinae]|uniref:hypothetical protein n=1 Tax=Thalassoroseus pseudoceratinae TaxID=2713176 RepID=UPI001424A2EE|nr:hypothetical protein [Thalassoroseus pseudoceratinae]
MRNADEPNDVAVASAAAPFTEPIRGYSVWLILCAAVVSGAVWALCTQTDSTWNSVASPAALVGHAVFAALACGSLLDFRRRQRDRHALMRVHKTSDDERTYWDEMFHSCLDATDYHAVARTWTDDITKRQSLLILLAVIPLCCGALAGLQTLNLTTQGSALLGFSEVFRPLIIGAGETLVLALAIGTNRWLWANDFATWWRVRENRQVSEEPTPTTVSVDSLTQERDPLKDTADAPETVAPTSTPITKTTAPEIEKRQTAPQSETRVDPDHKAAPVDVPLDATGSSPASNERPKRSISFATRGPKVLTKSDVEET